MALSGHTREFSLVDLLQMQNLSRADCVIQVTGPRGSGRLAVVGGTVVDADYGDLRGEDAALAMIVEEDLHYRVDRDLTVSRRTLDLPAQELVLEAMRRQDEGSLRPTPAPERPPAPPPGHGTAAAPPPPARQPAGRPTARRGGGRGLWIVAAAAVVAVGVGGLFGWMTMRGDEAPAAQPTGSVTEAPRAGGDRAPVDAADLVGPRDHGPERISGSDPLSPDPGAGLQPTVVVQLTIGEDGSVSGAGIYRARPELAAYERRALEAVASWRFRPAQREGVAVPVRINWPVRFEAVAP